MHDSKQDFRGSRSIWAESEENSPYSVIPDDAMTDVCIVGAGIAGISTAYLLAREGLSVIVLDDGPIGGGETGRTTAHLSNAIDDRYVEIERIHGRDGGKSYRRHQPHRSHRPRRTDLVRLRAVGRLSLSFARRIAVASATGT